MHAVALEGELSAAEVRLEEERAEAEATAAVAAESRSLIVVGEFAAIPMPDPPGYYILKWQALPFDLLADEKSDWGKLPAGRPVCLARYATLVFSFDTMQASLVLSGHTTQTREGAYRSCAPHRIHASPSNSDQTPHSSSA